MIREPEIWKVIEEYPNYQISNWGRIMNIRTGNIRSHGKYLTSYVGNSLQQIRISRLVYKYFVGPLFNGLVIDHKDNDNTNDYYKNLQQITPRKNTSKDKWRKPGKLSKYVGVTKCKKRKTNPWKSSIRILGVQTHLGSFPTEELAHIAYQSALKLINT